VLIENILAAFEMDEILFSMKDHIVGLNSGKWDYIFSFIKKLSHDPQFVFPERSQITNDSVFLSTVEQLMVQTCKRRGALVTAGMAPFLRTADESINSLNKEKIKLLRNRQRSIGFDGALVADSIFVSSANYSPMPGCDSNNNGNTVQHLDEAAIAKMLIEVPSGTITSEGVMLNVIVLLNYVESWVRGFGAIDLNGQIEDLATAEICRAQLWQWIAHKIKVADGSAVTVSYVMNEVDKLIVTKKKELGAEFYRRQYLFAREKIFEMLSANSLLDFMPSLLYKYIVDF